MAMCKVGREIQKVFGFLKPNAFFLVELVGAGGSGV